jgi:putative FmdB family regulatory protein
MPTYQYKCTQCDSEKTVIRSIHENDPGYICEACKAPMRQVLGGVSLSFKGGGWAHKE